MNAGQSGAFRRLPNETGPVAYMGIEELVAKYATCIPKLFAGLKAGVVRANPGNKFDRAAPVGGGKETGLGREGGRQGWLDYCRPV